MRTQLLLFLIAIFSLSAVATVSFGGPMNSEDSHAMIQKSADRMAGNDHMVTLSGKATTPNTFISEDGVGYTISNKDVGQKLYNWSKVANNKIILTGSVDKQGNDMFLNIRNYDLYACKESNVVVPPLAKNYKDYYMYYMGPTYAESCSLRDRQTLGG